MQARYGGGHVTADFYLNVHFINATFEPEYTEMPFTTIDNATVKLHILLHLDDSLNKELYFTIDENVNAFTIDLTFEKKHFYDLISGNGIYQTSLVYEWSVEDQLFRLLMEH